MRFSTTALALIAIVSGVTAAPTKRQDSGDIDAVILQYALTVRGAQYSLASVTDSP